MNGQEAKAIVLEWLKDNSSNEPKVLLFELMRRHTDIVSKRVIQAYDLLETKGQYELLAEFAAWGLKEGAK
ncbi:TPA_asm: hypothetical protein GYP43_02975 [Listeria monocytogenes]|nr:hypothetical protein [Listeria monocytogenes]